MIDQPSLAILIDCWTQVPLWRPVQCYYRILQTIEDNPYIETVVLASYNCREEKIRNDTVWYQNYSNLFYHDTNRKITDLAHVHRVFEENDNIHSNENTFHDILKYVNPNKFQIAMKWLWELEYYLELNPHIKNIYVFGGTWELCARTRPLGYESLHCLNKVNLLTKSSCVFTDQGSNVNSAVSIKHPWINLTDDIFYLPQS